MCQDCEPNASWYRPIKKRCPECGCGLHVISFNVRMCFYCDWVEPDTDRTARMRRPEASPYGF